MKIRKPRNTGWIDRWGSKQIKGTLNVDSLQMRTKQVPVLWACFLLWNLYISSSQAVYPGIKARITQRALDYGELDLFRSQATNALGVACVPNEHFVNWAWDKISVGLTNPLWRCTRYLGRKCCPQNRHLLRGIFKLTDVLSFSPHPAPIYLGSK